MDKEKESAIDHLPFGWDSPHEAGLRLASCQEKDIGTLYHSFVEMGDLAGTAQRIFDPFSYRAVQETRLVPVGLGEADTLARHMPIVWIHDMVGGLQAVALRGLDPKRIPAAGRSGPLPLLLQAYPFRFRAFETGDFEIGLERILPRQERDDGSYIHDHQGHVLPGAAMKIAALEAFREGHETLRALTRALQGSAFIEELRLPETIAGIPGLPRMFAAREDADLEQLMRGLAQPHLALATRFIVAQRVSLYRMHRLISAMGGSG